MKTLYLCGAGNAEGIRLALRINRVHQCWDEIAVLDDDTALLGSTVVGVEVVGPFSMLADADSLSAEVVNNVARTRIMGNAVEIIWIMDCATRVPRTTMASPSVTAL